ncbi:class I adenylate-forming enzyme family protein [Cytobacillus kochii]|uniref:class I adenylate-forming enzyme family protein n=1 Tax=Cytobacillus kochii TaxID=859143 RepID=UPI002E1C539F|nr:class I adenylate-forming enzyme family protein [Cytobacillus kochii]
MTKQYFNRPFIVSEEGDEWTYGEIETLSKRLGAGLIKLGLKPKENVTIIMPNCSEFVVSKLAISFSAGVTVSLNYKLKKEELKYLLKNSNSSYILTLDKWNKVDFISILKDICPEVFEGKISPDFPQLKRVIVYSPSHSHYPGTVDFYTLLATMKSSQEVENLLSKIPKVSVEDVSDIMYTSGTTSLPKGVLVTHDMIWRSAIGSCINRGYQDGRSLFIPIPFYHCFAYIEGMVAGSMVGGKLVLQGDFNAKQSLNLMMKYKVSDILCVPTIALKILDEQRESKCDLSELTAMYCAGAEVTQKMWKELKKVLGIKELITGYGMTECAAGVLQTDPQDDIAFLSQYVGKTIPGGQFGLKELDGNNIQFIIRDVDTGKYYAHGSQGELVCRGPLVTKGYYNNQKETTKAIDENGWFRTGDLAYIDKNGYVSLKGRLKEIYRIGAENVSPKEIEDVLSTHNAIKQAYVVGVPDEVMGEVGMAWVVLESDIVISEKEIFAFANSKLAKFKVPKYIKIVKSEDLPLTSSGKVLKTKLKDVYAYEQSLYKSQF